MTLVKVKDHESLVRDTETNAIMNIDSVARLANRKRMLARMEEKKEIEKMKSDISNIQDMLVQILNKLK